MERRTFIKQSAMASGALLTSQLLHASAETATDHLTLLHTNDMHSRLLPFPDDAGRNAGLGGIAARSQLIKEIRAVNNNVLLLDAGDIFEGTPYFDLFKGEPELKAMSMMGYDAATIGEHDFDAGIENFATQLKHANFPFVCCNYDFVNTPLEQKILPYKIFQKQNIKVGVLGIGIELKGVIAEDLYGKTVYKDPIVSANTNADILKKQGCDMVVCLSHLGDRYFNGKLSDEQLAKESYNIDVIIGGHTHRFFTEPKKYTNKNGNDVYVNQVGWAGIQLGRLDYSFEVGKNKNLSKAHTVLVGRKTTE
jgi:5'-nucleotidase